MAIKRLEMTFAFFILCSYLLFFIIGHATPRQYEVKNNSGGPVEAYLRCAVDHTFDNHFILDDGMTEAFTAECPERSEEP